MALYIYASLTIIQEPISTASVEPVCTTEIAFQEKEVNKYIYYYNSTTFKERAKYIVAGQGSYCWTKFNLHLMEMVHYTKRQQKYIIPRALLKLALTCFGPQTQATAFTVLQELVESEMIEYLRNAVKLANYQEGLQKGVVTENIFDSVAKLKNVL